MRKFATVLVLITSLSIGVISTACSGAGGGEAKDNTIAATVNGRNIMLKEVERALTQQAGANVTKLSPLELAQARLQVLGNLIQREVLFQRADREKVLPTEDQIDNVINQQKQQTRDDLGRF